MSSNYPDNFSWRDFDKYNETDEEAEKREAEWYAGADYYYEEARDREVENGE